MNDSDPYERTYSYDSSESNAGNTEYTSENSEELKKHKSKPTGKTVVLAILVFVLFIGFRMARREIISEVLLDGFDTTEEMFADIERKQDYRATWEEYRKNEMANGGPTYLVEDVFATTLRPDHWDDFLVLTELPEDFYYKDRAIMASDPGDWTITEIFYDYGTNTEFIYFAQSADYDYNKGHLPNGIKKEEGKLYKEEKGTRNQIIWFYEDLTIYLEGNIAMDELEKIALSAVNYNELQYDYSAIEEVAGQYE